MKQKQLVNERAMTLRETAAAMNLSATGVQEIERRALDKCEKFLYSQGIDFETWLDYVKVNGL